MNQKLYAFWRHDVYPYVLGGEITNMREDGMVEVAGYGPGHWFTPFKIVPLEQGKRVARALESIRAEFQEEKRKLNKKYLEERERIITIPL